MFSTTKWNADRDRTFWIATGAEFPYKYSTPMKLLVSLSVTLVAFVFGFASHAEPLKWNAGVNSNWDTDTGNWTGSKWINGGDAHFDGAGAGTVNVVPGVSAGSLTFNKPGYILSGGTLALDGAVPAITANATATISAPLTTQASSDLTKAGVGTLILSAENGLSGNTTIKAGVLEIAATGKLYAVWTPAPRVVTVGPGGTLRVNGWGGYGGGGFGELDQLPCDNPDALVLDGGTLEFAGALDNYSCDRVFSIGPGGATLRNSSRKNPWSITSGTGSQAMITNNYSLTFDGDGINGEIAKNITGPGSVAKNGNGEWSLTAMNSYTGATIVNSGTLRIGSLTATFGVNSAVTLAGVAGATLQAVFWDGKKNVGINFSIGSLAGGGPGGGDVDLVSGTMTVGGDSSSTTFGGSILSSNCGGDNPNGTGGIVKTGGGNLTLSGSCTYNGPTTIDHGGLQVLGSLSPGSAVTVSAGGTLRGTGIIGGPLTVQGTLSPGTRASVGSLSVSNTLALTGTTAMRLDKSAANRPNDSIVGASRITYGGVLVVTNAGNASPAADDAFTLFSSGGYDGTFSRVTLPVLPMGLQWDSSKLATTGEIKVVRKP
jgi:autotransporter-associated beta strand protein